MNNLLSQSSNYTTSYTTTTSSKFTLQKRQSEDNDVDGVYNVSSNEPTLSVKKVGDIFKESPSGIDGAALSAQLDKVSSFNYLEPNWDSYGAEKIASCAILFARSLLSAVAIRMSGKAKEPVHAYAIAPLADGGVQLEWHGRNGILEVEIGVKGTYNLLHIFPDNHFTETSDASVKEVFGALASVLGMQSET